MVHQTLHCLHKKISDEFREHILDWTAKNNNVRQ